MLESTKEAPGTEDRSEEVCYTRKMRVSYSPEKRVIGCQLVNSKQTFYFEIEEQEQTFLLE